jgi:ATP-dependent protease ClpP protease subunit
MRWYGITDVCCPGDFREALEADEDITVYVNSDGGSLVAGNEIYCALAGHKRKTTAHIQSRAASAATVAIMGCSEIVAEPVSLICVHNPSTYAEGDSGVMRHTAEELENVKKAILFAYGSRMKKSEEEVSALMDKDMWIDAQTALSYGLVDKVAERRAVPSLVVNGSGYLQFPTEEMFEQFRADKEKEKTKTEMKKLQDAAMARLALYK